MQQRRTIKWKLARSPELFLSTKKKGRRNENKGLESSHENHFKFIDCKKKKKRNNSKEKIWNFLVKVYGMISRSFAVPFICARVHAVPSTHLLKLKYLCYIGWIVMPTSPLHSAYVCVYMLKFETIFAKSFNVVSIGITFTW